MEHVSGSMRRKFMREVRAADLHFEQLASASVVSEADLALLPASVQRYLRFMGVVGRPRDVSVRVHFTGRFRLKPGPFVHCEAWQYSTRNEVARIFHLRMHLFAVLPILARDTYRDGHGRMLGKLVDRFTIVDGTGPELDTGELVTYLNDAILFAPSLVLGPESRFCAVDEQHFDVTFTDRGRSVSARVTIDTQGAPTDFSTTDRYHQDNFDSPMVRTRWSTPIAAMQRVDGRAVIKRASAVWHLADGPFPYAELELDPAEIAFNRAPDV